MPVHSPIPPTSKSDLDKAVADLRSNADRFARLGLDDRIHLLEGMKRGFEAIAEKWVRAGCQAKDIPFDSPLSGEEWLAGPVVLMRNFRLLLRTLRQIRKTGAPEVPPLKPLPHGTLAARVFPASKLDRILFAGFEGWTWLKPEVTEDNIRDHMAVRYRRPKGKGAVSLILGAGNVSSIAPMDALYKSFVELHVCIVKMNPVNEYLGPLMETAFREMIDQGFLRIVYGGGDVGAYLVNHPDVADVHITGSDETHDRITWGPPGPERDRRRREGKPLLTKPITSELGNVSGVVIVPALYSEKELSFQAENVASMLTNNGGFNCNAAKVLVLAKQWPQRDDFLSRLRTVLADIPPRRAYYPGAQERHARFIEGHDHVDLIGTPSEGHLPWALIRDLDPNDDDEICFRKEAFCSILGETSLDGPDAVTFLKNATTFCNERLWGTLNISIIVPPDVEKSAEGGEALHEAIRELRFGTITINHWAALGYGLVSTPWGGHAGATLDDVQSGIGFVHNTPMLEGIEKCVIRGPIVVFPKPAWFRTNKNSHKIAQAMVDFEASPSLLKLPRIILEAMKG